MSTEKLLNTKEALEVLNIINAMYPDAKSELVWDNKFHLLCAVLMSAQTTDKMVNRIMPKFIMDYPTPTDLAQASIKQIEEHISQIGLYHSKAKHLQAMARILVEKYHSEIPINKKDLITLPGVGEKTANVVLADGFGVPAIAVDTHVARISKRFHIVAQDAKPLQIEKRLEEILPKDEWIHTHHAMILFGRYAMTARDKNDPYSYLKK
ncbi:MULTISPECIES: endonuclease III [unclassified Lactobacillus]|uniref:endonuclease III n=1 Tax=unclassified Lactobacillus TaxID=2620435 RepID=UPI000EFBC073|nr:MULTISPECIES: endonuclease III [unclassified Lactobacillus]RMC24637.1 endonuclease III [Lactobacillus sp. ESL0247]RMC28909.1 endonuclease III [Lactobacillus sp. ESL0246]RMC32154.1 endonuclease III [Lactobacillus sp. ESL0245]RMC48799.1 endonuclease III [Lactobacillus sp. ESL0228]